MHRDAARPSSVTGLAVLLALGVCACTLGGTVLAGESGWFASIWPANALVLSALLLRPQRSWGALLTGGALGNWAGNLLFGDGIFQASWLTAANLAEIALAATAMRMLDGAVPRRLTRRWLVCFGLAAAIACAVSATIASPALEGARGDSVTEWLTYFAAHMIGMLALVPLLIALAIELPDRDAPRIAGHEMKPSSGVPGKDTAPPPLPITAIEERQTVSGDGIRILLAQSVELNRAVAGDLLDRLGYAYDVAGDAQDALEKIDHSLLTGDYYDLFLIDTRMPGIDGVEAVRRSRGCVPYARTPIIGLAANVFAADVAACLAAGMDTVLRRPVKIEELRVAIETTLGGSAAGLDATASETADLLLHDQAGTVPPAARPRSGDLIARYAEQRAEMLARINALVGGGDFAPEILEEIVALAHRLAESAGMAGDPATGDLAYALEQCVRGFSAGGEGAVRQAAAALQQAA